MAIAQLGSGATGNTSGSSSSNSITIPSGTDLLVVYAYRMRTAGGTSAAPTSVTIAGNAMTDLGLTPTGEQNSGWGKMYYYLSPPSGAQTLAASGSGGSSEQTGCDWWAISGAKQSGQPDSSGFTNSSATTALALTTTVVAPNCWAVIGFLNQGSTPSSYTNGTSRQFTVPNNGVGVADSNGTVSTGSFTITVNQTSNLCNGIIASFAPATTTTVAPDLRTYFQ